MTFKKFKSKIGELEISLYLCILGYGREDLRELIGTSRWLSLPMGYWILVPFIGKWTLLFCNWNTACCDWRTGTIWTCLTWFFCKSSTTVTFRMKNKLRITVVQDVVRCLHLNVSMSKNEWDCSLFFFSVLGYIDENVRKWQFSHCYLL